MSAERIEAVIDCQTDLIAAIDRQDSAAIVRASEALAVAVSLLGDVSEWPQFAPAADRPVGDGELGGGHPELTERIGEPLVAAERVGGVLRGAPTTSSGLPMKLVGSRARDEPNAAPAVSLASTMVALRRHDRWPGAPEAAYTATSAKLFLPARIQKKCRIASPATA